DKYCICESPERYLKKEGDKISSSPIKGTSRRYPEDEKKDEESRRALLSSAKDKSENVMVVDLVRNDLSKVCREGTVQVEELFKLKSFPAIHHLVSTVSGNLVEGLNWIDAVEASFPMGSMTGAPKKKVLELIRKFEATGRGLFSGTIGFIKPNGDCDFNVVIRSILIDKKKKTLSFWAGSGITFYSDPEAEYEECLLKAAAIQAVLNKAS
ncbi:MAG: chorismate-binding protein, partial [Ferruginibacter sp.]